MLLINHDLGGVPNTITTFLNLILALILDVVLTTIAHSMTNSAPKKLEFAPLVAWGTESASMYP